MTDTEEPAATDGADQPTPQPVPAEPEAKPGTSKPSPLAPTRTSGYWASVVVGLLVLLVLLVLLAIHFVLVRVLSILEGRLVQ